MCFVGKRCRDAENKRSFYLLKRKIDVLCFHFHFRVRRKQKKVRSHSNPLLLTITLSRDLLHQTHIHVYVWPLIQSVAEFQSAGRKILRRDGDLEVVVFSIIHVHGEGVVRVQPNSIIFRLIQFSHLRHHILYLIVLLPQNGLLSAD